MTVQKRKFQSILCHSVVTREPRYSPKMSEAAKAIALLPSSQKHCGPRTPGWWQVLGSVPWVVLKESAEFLVEESGTANAQKRKRKNKTVSAF